MSASVLDSSETAHGQPDEEAYEHPPFLLARHRAFLTEAIAVVKLLQIEESRNGVLVAAAQVIDRAPLKASVAKQPGSSRPNAANKPRIAFNSSWNRTLQHANDLGLRAAFFIPGDRKPSHLRNGFPKEIPASWIELDKKVRNVDASDKYVVQASMPDTSLDGATGFVALQAANAHAALQSFLEHLLNYAHLFPIHVAGQLFDLPEDEVVAPSITPSATDLSEDQSVACNYHLANWWTFVWGPPGTGKSTVLNKMVELNLSGSRSVLLTAASNDAVDSVAVKLCEAVGSARAPHLSDAVAKGLVVRFGSSPRVPDYAPISEKAVRKLIADETDQSAKDVVLTPLVSLSTFYRCFLTKPEPVDTVLIDEAGMVCPPIAYAIACLARSKVVVVGDPKQTQPIFTGSPRLFKRHVLEHWKSNVFDFAKLRTDPSLPLDPRVVILRTQYRFTPSILKYVNATGLYRDFRCPDPPRPLTAAEDEAANLSPLPGQNVVVIDTSALPADRPQKHLNNTHLELGKSLVSQWLEGGLRSRVGITTPYSAQAKAYRRWALDSYDDQITASTVHGLQGAEFPALIYDFFEGPESEHFYPNGRGLHFLTDDSLNAEAIFLHNVGISRARSKLVFLINVEYTRSHFSASSFAQRILDLAAAEGAVVCGRSWKTLTPDALIPSAIFASGPDHFPAEEFYSQLGTDAACASAAIRILSPSSSPEYVESFSRFLASRRVSPRVSITLHVNGATRMDLSSLQIPNLRIQTVGRYGMPGFAAFDQRVSYRSPPGIAAHPLNGDIPESILRVIQ